jgi:hypothetical protein
MVVYSTEKEDTVKVVARFPEQSSVDKFYNYRVQVANRVEGVV